MGWPTILLFPNNPPAAPAATPTVTFDGRSLSIREVGGHRVYLREKWGDAWSEQEHVHCDEATWSAQPSTSSAQLTWCYERSALPGETAFIDRAKKLGYTRQFVKIEFDMQPIGVDELGATIFKAKSWFGILEVAVDDLDGAWFDPAGGDARGSGSQTFSCVGMEKLYADEKIRSAFIDDGLFGATIARPLQFNRDGRPNMSPSFPGQYAFGTDPDTNIHWGTVAIVEYVLKNHTPKDAAGGDVFTALLNDPHNLLPVIDEPQLDPSFRDALSVLREIIPRERLYSFKIEVDQITEIVYLIPFTLTPNNILSPPGAIAVPVKKNPDVIRLVFQTDPSANANVKLESSEVYDQVVMVGARMRSVASFSYADATLGDNWTSSLRTAYNVGASLAGDYPGAADIVGRRKRNNEARQRELVRDVFASFKIPDDWDGRCGNGEGLTSTFQPVFIADANPNLPPLPHYPPDLVIERTMPLLEAVDYSGDFDSVDQSTGFEERPPFVAWKLVADELGAGRRWLNVEHVGRLANLHETNPDQDVDWSAHVKADGDEPTIRLQVSGGPQHVIAYVDFSPLAEDEPFGQNNFREMIVTASVPWDRYASAAFPAKPTVAAGQIVRTKTIEAGSGYRQDWLVPGTVVGIDEYGALQRSTTGGWINDARPELLALARIAHAWYSIERATISFETEQLTDALFVGQLVEQINQRAADDMDNWYAVNSVITEITIRTPRSEDNSEPRPPTMRVTTGHAELDPLGFPRERKNDVAVSEVLTTLGALP